MKGRILTVDEAPRGARVIVCGGRWFGLQAPSDTPWGARQALQLAARQRNLLFVALDRLEPREVAHGGAPGADELAGEWAASRGVPCQVFPKGHRSGYLRNPRMFRAFKPDGVVAFKGHNGTADMDAVARAGGAWVVRPR